MPLWITPIIHPTIYTVIDQKNFLIIQVSELSWGPYLADHPLCATTTTPSHLQISHFFTCITTIFVHAMIYNSLISDLEILKTKDIQDSHRFKIFFPFDLWVNFSNDPWEAPWIKGHGKRVSGVSSLGANRAEDILSLTMVMYDGK